MEIITTLISFVTNQDLVIRIVLLILLSLYVLFAIVVAVQIKTLSTTVNQGSSSTFVRMVAWIHVIIPVALLILTVLTL